jgi:hypothetical protein
MIRQMIHSLNCIKITTTCLTQTEVLNPLLLKEDHHEKHKKVFFKCIRFGLNVFIMANINRKMNAIRSK